MFAIPIILGSIREGRQSPRVAKFIERKLRATGRVDSQILDLKEFDLPMMEERLRLLAASFPVSRVGESIAEDGTAVDPSYDKRVETWLGELLWATEAFADRRVKDAVGAAR
ncbi:MAG: hypothetical protein WC538_04540 [Thermoanaerobaculia bacterium]|jgi:hypothetical protein